MLCVWPRRGCPQIRVTSAPLLTGNWITKILYHAYSPLIKGRRTSFFSFSFACCLFPCVFSRAAALPALDFSCTAGNSIVRFHVCRKERGRSWPFQQRSPTGDGLWYVPRILDTWKIELSAHGCLSEFCRRHPFCFLLDSFVVVVIYVAVNSLGKCFKRGILFFMPVEHLVFIRPKKVSMMQLS